MNWHTAAQWQYIFAHGEVWRQLNGRTWTFASTTRPNSGSSCSCLVFKRSSAAASCARSVLTCATDFSSIYIYRVGSSTDNQLAHCLGLVATLKLPLRPVIYFSDFRNGCTV